MQRVIIHGGCGARESGNTSFEQYDRHLNIIITQVVQYLQDSNDAIATALFAAKLLEDDPVFNAGTGSRLQQDGQVRMSASFMDSIHNKFAAVINVQNIQNPSAVAYGLHKQHHSILAGEFATQYAHNILGVPNYNPITEHRYQEYLELKSGKTGTIGVVVLDDNGVICAITSTGGAGYEVPGRVGDSPTIAGNFACSSVGVSCTGIGEEIVNQAVAARVSTRVIDGMPLQQAIDKSIAEADSLDYYVGIISLDKNGNIVSGTTSIAQTLYAYYDGSKTATFYDEMIVI